jgi:lysophospholipase L1-like esterase
MTKAFTADGAMRAATALAVVVLMGWTAIADASAANCAPTWVGAWGRSAAAASDRAFKDQTVRMISHVSAGGSRVRLRLSNLFGSQPVTFDAVSVGLRQPGAGSASPAVAPGSSTRVTFGGASRFTIPPGASVQSDPAALKVNTFDDVVTSLYSAGSTGPATVHPETQQTAYVADGNHAADAAPDRFSALPAEGFAPSLGHYFLTDIDVLAGAGAGTLVTLGDSITNGTASTPNANDRYPDDLARRLAAQSGPEVAVSNQGIGGDRITHPEFYGGGVGMLVRLQRDVLSQPALKSVVLLGGINDIGGQLAPADDVIAVMRTIIDRVHAAGARIYGATLSPSGDLQEPFVLAPSYSTPIANQQRAQVNAFIRTSGAFDGVIDFDQVLRDPNNPDRVQHRYDSGDHLHPNDAGYKAMADAIALDALRGAVDLCRTTSLPQGLALDRHGIGPLRLGLRRSPVLRLQAQPFQRTRYSFRYRVDDGTAGRVIAVFSDASSRGRVELVASTVPEHGRAPDRVGTPATSFTRAHPSRRQILPAVFRPSPADTRVIGVSHGRVRFIAVADHHLLSHPRELRTALARAGL